MVSFHILMSWMLGCDRYLLLARYPGTQIRTAKRFVIGYDDVCVFLSQDFSFSLFIVFFPLTYTLMSFRVQLTFYFGNILEYIYFNFGDVPQLALSFSMID